MDWASVTAREGIQRLKRGARAVDVRSPGEFEQGFIPGFVNIPILNDDHRHQVGLTYKLAGQPEAIHSCHRLVGPLRAGLVENWRAALEPADVSQRLLICWRGGLRSRTAGQWLAESDFLGSCVMGGYKAMRRALTETFARSPALLVLSGLTGSGKTQLLRRLNSERVIDLEGLANHRGSSFGLRLHSVQPQQQTFENAIALALFEGPAEMTVEAESRMVGNCVLPAALKAAMDASPRVLLESTPEARTLRLFAEYVAEPCATFGASAVFAHLSAALKRIQKRLGGLRFQQIHRLLEEAFASPDLIAERHAPWIESLLREYYDPQYEYSQAGTENVLFRGDEQAVQDFLTHRLDGRRA